MGSHTQDIDEALDAEGWAVVPDQLSATGDVDGSSIDRQSLTNPKAFVFSAAVNSVDSSDEIKFKLQESTDDSSWSDVSGKSVTLNDGNKEDRITVDAKGLDRYLRIKAASGDQTSSSTEFYYAVSYAATGAKESQSL